MKIKNAIGKSYINRKILKLLDWILVFRVRLRITLLCVRVLYRIWNSI